MTVKTFKLDDLGWFTPNEFSEPYHVLPLLIGRGGWVANTLWSADNTVDLIACYRSYWGNCWEGFFLISKDFDAAKAVHVRHLINQHMLTTCAIRLQTHSQKCDELRAWHKFLGFTLEGTKRKMMFNRDYDCWAIVREGT